MLPPDHLARFIVDVITHLDLSALYAHYSHAVARPSHRKFF